METIDGTAVVDEDFLKIDDIITFEPGETEKEVKGAFTYTIFTSEQLFSFRSHKYTKANFQHATKTGKRY